MGKFLGRLSNCHVVKAHDQRCQLAVRRLRVRKPVGERLLKLLNVTYRLLVMLHF